MLYNLHAKKIIQGTFLMQLKNVFCIFNIKYNKIRICN